MENKPIEAYKLELQELRKEDQKPYKKINCPSCDTEVSAQNLDLGQKLGKCGACNAVFPIHKELDSLQQLLDTKTEQPKPVGLELYHFGDEMDITVKQPWNVVEIMSIMLFPKFGLLMVMIFFVSNKDIPALLPLIFGPLGILSIAYAFQRRHHKMHITVNPETLSVLRRPRKMIKDKQYESKDINQIYIVNQGGVAIVKMILDTPKGQKHETLISSTYNIPAARYIEQEIERKLGIVDRRVPEEKGPQAIVIS